MVGLDERRFGLVVAPGVQVSVVSRKPGRHHFHSEAMPLQNREGSVPEVDFVFIDLSRREQFGLA